MLDSYKNDLNWSKSNAKTIKKLGVRTSKDKSIDQKINNLHEEVFENVDCLDCANCCKTTGPLLKEKDISRLSKRLKMSEQDFFSTYVRTDEVGDFVFKSMPCPFLLDDNHCSVYEARPQACRRFPHTDEAGQMKIYNLTKKNALICPAVSRILRKLDQQL